MTSVCALPPPAPSEGIGMMRYVCAHGQYFTDSCMSGLTRVVWSDKGGLLSYKLHCRQQRWFESLPCTSKSMDCWRRILRGQLARISHVPYCCAWMKSMDKPQCHSGLFGLEVTFCGLKLMLLGVASRQGVNVDELPYFESDTVELNCTEIHHGLD